ncbi:MAG: phosphate ABC transporter substrate-binding protein [Bernardetiaceae bacterium]|nr:phosphate ABC transporter substrate-binding protein [Bernardetiaceae bacterium]
MLSCKNNTSQLIIKGSDTEVNLMVLLAEAYWQQHPKWQVSVSGGGSGVGIVALLNGRADIANSSRPMNAKEQALFQRYGVACDTFIFAEDAIAIIAHATNPIDSLTVEQLQAIFSGQLRNWQSLNGNHLKINLYGRPNNSGTHAWLQKKLGISFCKHVLEMNGNAQIVEAIKLDQSGLGYVSAGYVVKNYQQTGEGFKILRIAAKGQAACSPLDKEAVEQQKYYLLRPLYQYIRRESAQKAQPFIEFIKSPAGEEILLANGYFLVRNDSAK